MSSNELTRRSLDAETAVITAGEVLDNSNSEEMMKHLNEAEGDGAKKVIIDMKNLTFISSAGVGVILGTISRFRDKGGDILLQDVSQNIKHILAALDLLDFIRIIDSTAQNPTDIKS